MHDTLAYFQQDPIHRRYHHHELTFSLVYAFSENFILPLSHDEVVHGKGSLYSKMPGDRWQKLANLRALYAYMWAHPGKKLLFMGGELAQESEWSHERSLDWHLLENPENAGIQSLVRDLNRVYRERPAMWQIDDSDRGFYWLEPNDAANNVVAFCRVGEDPVRDVVAVVCNLSPVPREGYRLGLPQSGRWVEARQHRRRRLRRQQRRQPRRRRGRGRRLERPAVLGRAHAAAAQRAVARAGALAPASGRAVPSPDSAAARRTTSAASCATAAISVPSGMVASASSAAIVRCGERPSPRTRRKPTSAARNSATPPPRTSASAVASGS